MDLFTRGDLRLLVEQTPEWAVSIYVPTYRTGPEIRQNRIRVKNALDEAEETLVTRGCSRSQARQLLNGARRYETEAPLWTRHGDGLAIFAAPGLFRAYCLPLSFADQLHVRRRFHLAPILPILEADGRFYVLAVSQNHVRLLEGSRFSVTELHPENLPLSLRSALNIDEFTEYLQQHSAGSAISADFSHGYGDRGPTGGEKMIFHGQGGSGLEVHKRDELLQYFHRLNDGLQKFLPTDHIPWVFAGVEYLFPIFREACHNPNLVLNAVAGNPDRQSHKQLHQRAWEVVRSLFQARRDESLRRFGTAQARGQATDSREQLATAARSGQIDTLLLAEGQQQPGFVDDATGEVLTGPAGNEPDAESEDLLNYAALWTIINGGLVFTLRPEQMPTAEPAAAILRFAMPG